MFNVTKYLFCALALAFTIPRAFCGEWKMLPRINDNPLVAANFKHDDGGTLVVMCDTNTKIVSIGLDEPRAHWQTGASMQLTTKADEGSELTPSTGLVIGPTRIVVKYQATFDLWTMSQAKNDFVVSVGDYARIFPAANFKTVVDPVLRACGDHF
jgi:hypothetical protein